MQLKSVPAVIISVLYLINDNWCIDWMLKRISVWQWFTISTCFYDNSCSFRPHCYNSAPSVLIFSRLPKCPCATWLRKRLPRPTGSLSCVLSDNTGEVESMRAIMRARWWLKGGNKNSPSGCMYSYAYNVCRSTACVVVVRLDAELLRLRNWIAAAPWLGRKPKAVEKFQRSCYSRTPTEAQTLDSQERQMS